VGASRDRVVRLAFRGGYWVLRIWWFIARPQKRGVKCVLVSDHEVLLVRHTYGRVREWDLPGGGVRRRERPHDAARREIREELGVDLPKLRLLGDLFARNDFKRDHLWCFSCELDGRGLEPDRAEIAEAQWFPRDRLPAGTTRTAARVIALDSSGTRKHP
jgi:8-oxo-dGTP pyrophosphatase MutT (NUDIX family)